MKPEALSCAALIPAVIVCVACAAGPAVAAGDPNGAGSALAPFADAQNRDSSGPRRPATLRRLVRHFDFEEAEQAPREMPLNFYRYGADASGGGATAQGFPPFGSMRLTNEVAYSGRWSFEFDLDGGSLAARVPTAVIPVMPMADYVVSARVRTKEIRHARARLSAWLHDARGEPIAASRVQSSPISTDGEWTSVNVHVRGRFEDAADLVLELALLQPRHFMGAEDDPMVLEDVQGRAWFDDVTVWHVPRAELTRLEGDRLAFSVAVHDIAHDQLDARLQIYDIDGQPVVERSFSAPRSPATRSVEVPSLAYGWYRAVLSIYHGETLTARRTLSVLHAPAHTIRREAVSPAARFSLGLSLPRDWRRHAAHVPPMVRSTGAGAVIMPVGPAGSALPSYTEEQVRLAIDQLRRDGASIVFAFSNVVDGLAQHLGIDSDEVFSAIRAAPELWRQSLDASPELRSIVPGTDRWLLGDVAGAGEKGNWHDNLASIIREARRQLSRFAHDHDIVLPVLAEHAGLPDAGESERILVIPHAVRPQVIEAVIANGNAKSSVYLGTAPAGLYGAREAVSDTAMRILHAWRAGASRITVRAPWFAAHDGTLSPEPTLLPLRILASHLNGRRFAGELSLGQGVHAWILEGEAADDDALLVWRDHMDAARRHQTSFSLQLGEHDVWSVDLFGNARTIPLVGAAHIVDLEQTPVFIEGVSAPLVMFRGSFAVRPSFIPAERRVHEHMLVLENPWNMPISGRIQLAEDDRWRATPRTHEFSVPARGTAELPVQIILDRGIAAGRQSLRAAVTLNADANYDLTLEAPIEIGLRNIDTFATWQIVRNHDTGDDDLVITQFVRNTATGRSPEAGTVNADVFMIAPGVPHQRRLVSGLRPGELARRSFRVAGGAALLEGQKIRLGLASRDSAERLNLILEIPELRGYDPQGEFRVLEQTTGAAGDR